jgi:hypothetical protein
MPVSVSQRCAAEDDATDGRSNTDCDVKPAVVLTVPAY